MTVKGRPRNQKMLLHTW